MATLNKTQEKKLKRALELATKAMKIVDDLHSNCATFRHGSNSNTLLHRLYGAVSVLEQGVNDKSY